MVICREMLQFVKGTNFKTASSQIFVSSMYFLLPQAFSQLLYSQFPCIWLEDHNIYLNILLRIKKYFVKTPKVIPGTTILTGS